MLTHQEPNRLPAVEVLDGVTVRRFELPVSSRHYAASPALWAHLRRAARTYDVVHAHGYHALPALAAAIFKQSPLVFTPHYHGTGHSRFRKLLHVPYRHVGRLAFERADRTIAVSQAEASLILGHFPKIRDRLHVIPNGVDQEALDSASPFDTGGKVVLSAGRIEAYKQVDRTVEAMRHLPGDFELRVTGDGPARAEAERLAGSLGLGARIRFLGRVSDAELYRWFRTADVYVSMSSNEAMPVTFIESLAAGASVVASDIPAHRDLIEKTGGSITLVPLDVSPVTLAHAIERRASVPPTRPVIDSWEHVTTRTHEVYRESVAAFSLGP